MESFLQISEIIFELTTIFPNNIPPRYTKEEA